jgi:hypothetical protein
MVEFRCPWCGGSGKTSTRCLSCGGWIVGADEAPQQPQPGNYTRVFASHDFDPFSYICSRCGISFLAAVDASMKCAVED